jgi:hypothetical protein
LALIGIFVLLLLVAPAASADRGMIAPPGTSVYEPGQRAIVAWNGGREVLILSTDVYGSDNTWALEILPLPSRPAIEAGEFDSFIAVQDLLLRYAGDMYAQRGYGRAGLENVPQLEVIFHEQIGAHDITVVVAENTQELISWAEDFLGTRAQGISWMKLEDIAAGYIRRGIKYWVFDIIDLSDHMKSREPIVYTFESNHLYYPLEISSLASGTTEITLYTLTSDKPDARSVQGAGFHILSLEAGGENFPLEFEVGKNDLRRISTDVEGLFGSGAWLTVLGYSGTLDDLSGDLILGPAAGPEYPEPNRTLALLLTAAMIGALIVIFALVYRISRSEQHLSPSPS